MDEFEFFHNLKVFLEQGDMLSGWDKQERWKIKRSSCNFILKGSLTVSLLKFVQVTGSVCVLTQISGCFTPEGVVLCVLSSCPRNRRVRF